ncbi:MAG TPA: hypothetical protein VFU90_00345, partial [Candidatus Tumulicola sp.]|nr:hypothetical protein [Candidatus Tumulicola sp.]
MGVIPMAISSRTTNSKSASPNRTPRRRKISRRTTIRRRSIRNATIVARETIAVAKTSAVAKATGAVAIEAETGVDAVASDVAVDVVAVDVQDREARLAQADAISRHRNMLRPRAISVATIRAATIHAATMIAATDPIKADAATTIAATVVIGAVQDGSTTAAPKADRVLHRRKDRAAKKKFCCRASRSRSIARVPQPPLRQRLSSSTSRTTSRNQSSMNRSRAGLGLNPPTPLVVHPAFQAGCSPARAPKRRPLPRLPKA